MKERNKKFIYNSLASLLYEVVSIVCSFILPRLILNSFGSSYNGLTSSVSQFISYVALLKSGIGGVTRASLYKPLAEHNDYEISGIVVATTNFMRRVALIFAGALLIFSVIYATGMRDQFEWFYTFSLILIIGISTFAQYYFSVSYQMLLRADQREYVIVLINILTTILSTIVSSALILSGFELRIVKLGAAIAFMISPLFINLYVKKHYNINKKVEPNNEAISQRWDSFTHQLASFIHGNTDIVILTFFSTTLEISVYSVYYLVLHGLRKAVVAISVGIEAMFGNMLAKKEMKQIENWFPFFEWMLYGVSTILFSVGIVLCTSFIKLYTRGVTDVDYDRMMFAVIACVGEFFYCVRIPYESMANAAGHYRQTRNGAIAEPMINIGISLALVKPLGIVGVAVGTMVAMVFRTFQYARHVRMNIVPRKVWNNLKETVKAAGNVLITYLICHTVNPSVISSYHTFIVYGAIDVVIALAILLIVNFVVDGKQTLKYFKSMHGILKSAIKSRISKATLRK